MALVGCGSNVAALRLHLWLVDMARAPPGPDCFSLSALPDPAGPCRMGWAVGQLVSLCHLVSKTASRTVVQSALGPSWKCHSRLGKSRSRHCQARVKAPPLRKAINTSTSTLPSHDLSCPNLHSLSSSPLACICFSPQRPRFVARFPPIQPRRGSYFLA